MADESDQYEIPTIEDSARSRGMWAGAFVRTRDPERKGIRPAEPQGPGEEAAQGEALRLAPPGAAWDLAGLKLDHVPVVLKAFDEVIVNSTDHVKRCLREHPRTPAKCVTRICVTFNPRTGRFSCENDGPGLPVIPHKKASLKKGREVYVPEVVFAWFLAGSNAVKPPDSVTGGCNGLGAKLSNIHSMVFEVVTQDGMRGLHYRQTFLNRLQTITPPTVTATSAAEKPFTKITFIPAYAAFGYQPEGGDRLTPADGGEIEAWLRWRMFQAAAYVGPGVRVTFNGELCPTTSALALAEIAAPRATHIALQARVAEKLDPCHKHPWDIAVAVVPGQKKFAHISVINGVVTSKGPHLALYKKRFAEAAEAKLRSLTKDRAKTLSTAEACAGLTIVFAAPYPGADWSGQRKDVLDVAPAGLARYKISAAALGKVGELIAAGVLAAGETGAKRKKRVVADKYTRARRAGTKDSAKCVLLAGEGDSALQLLRLGLTLGKKNPGGPTFDFYGIYSLGGVIMNAVKDTAEVLTAAGETLLVRSERVRKNKVLATLNEILGLEFTCSYATEEERAQLNYGAIVGCVDQDLDGTGKILSLLLAYFYLFWPALVRAGYVRRLLTPVIRVYPTAGTKKEKKTPAAEFFYEDEYARWAEARGGAEAVGRSSRVKYYKGLASHGTDEAVDLFRRFDELQRTFACGDGDRALFNVYFGPAADLRREVLATPVAPLSPGTVRRIAETRQIPCRIHLERDTKAYKLDAIERQIPSHVDGMTRARRKILAGSLAHFSQGNQDIKVFQLGGYVALKMCYHHGSDSLNASITKMAQRFPGANHYPYLVGVGQFGSRHLKNDAGSPRYISVKLALPFVRALFGLGGGDGGDRYLLPYEFVDGARAEPSYYVPVLPMAALESVATPSEGWRHMSFARDLAQVTALVRAYAAGDPLVHVAEIDFASGAGVPAALREKFPLDLSRRTYGAHLSPDAQGELVRQYRGQSHAFGYYWAEAGTGAGETDIHVTELPPGCLTQTFLDSITKPTKKGGPNPRMAYLVEPPINHSGDGLVDVRIRLKPGAYEEIAAKFGDHDADAIEDFLKLRGSLRPYLNYYAEPGKVVEYGEDYHALVFSWLPVRRDLYRRRLERQAVILRLRIWLEESTLRYIPLAGSLDLARCADEAAAAATLEAAGFVRANATLLAGPKFTPYAELEELVQRGPGATYNYILDLRERALIETARLKREADVSQMRADLSSVEGQLREEPFPGASAWMEEIDAVGAAIALGEKTDWDF